jgi:hypothetical protein
MDLGGAELERKRFGVGRQRIRHRSDLGCHGSGWNQYGSRGVGADHKWNQCGWEWGRYGQAWVANGIDADRDEFDLYPSDPAWTVNGTDGDRK